MVVTEVSPARSVPGYFAPRPAEGNVVWLRGEHDISTVTSLAYELARAIGSDDLDLVLDLSGVRFMSAATVGLIVGAENFLRSQSRAVSLRDPSEPARRVLELCGRPFCRGSSTLHRAEL